VIKKDSSFDKIEVVRSAVSNTAVSNSEGRFLIASDLPEETFGERTEDMNDISGIADIITEKTGTQQ